METAFLGHIGSGCTVPHQTILRPAGAILCVFRGIPAGFPKTGGREIPHIVGKIIDLSYIMYRQRSRYENNYTRSRPQGQEETNGRKKDGKKRVRRGRAFFGKARRAAGPDLQHVVQSVSGKGRRAQTGHVV